MRSWPDLADARLWGNPRVRPPSHYCE